MAISAVKQNTDSHLSTVVKSTALGAAGGYAFKYLWPVTKQEDSFNRKVMINYCHKITNKSKVQDFKEMPEITKAQDTFVKMIESKDKNAFTKNYINNRVRDLGGEDSAAAKEFRAIIRDVNSSSKELFKRWGIAYHMMIKYIRPAVPFLVAGAGVGFFAGVAHNVLKTDYMA